VVGIALAAQLWGYGFFLTGMFLRAFGVGVIWVFSTQLLLQVLPDAVRGRVFATEFALHTLASTASAGVGGWLLDSEAFDVSIVLYGMAAIGLIPEVLWSLWLFLRGSKRVAATISDL
jgi:predicted MFS family arabinose efflux permease